MGNLIDDHGRPIRYGEKAQRSEMNVDPSAGWPRAKARAVKFAYQMWRFSGKSHGEAIALCREKFLNDSSAQWLPTMLSKIKDKGAA